MRKYTNRSLLISFALHIAAMLAISPFLVNHFAIEKESISAEILEPESEKPMRERILPPRTPVVPQVSETEASPASPASPTYAPEVTVPKHPFMLMSFRMSLHTLIFRKQMRRVQFLTPVLGKMAHSQVPLSQRGSEEPGLGALDAEDVEPADMGVENTLQKAQAQRMWNSQRLRA